MDESQRRAWRALGLGPEWASRLPEGGLPGAVLPADAAASAEPAAVGRPSVPAAPLAPAAALASALPDPLAAAPPTNQGAHPDAGSGEDDRAPRHGAAPADARPPPDGGAGEVVRVDPASDEGASSPARRRAIGIARLDWQPLREQVTTCTACALCRTRSRTVFGVGAAQARWMLVGEAPGAEEDAKGEPFVGKAGQLLDAMLGAIGLDRRADVFIANVLKCRPPRNRDPLPEEVAACEPFLLRQLELVAPDVVLVLGRFAAQSVLGTDASIASLRGRVHRKEVGGRSIPLVVTYHPAYLLRTPADKSKSWADLLLARRAARY